MGADAIAAVEQNLTKPVCVTVEGERHNVRKVIAAIKQIPCPQERAPIRVGVSLSECLPAALQLLEIDQGSEREAFENGSSVGPGSCVTGSETCSVQGVKSTWVDVYIGGGGAPWLAKARDKFHSADEWNSVHVVCGLEKVSFLFSYLAFLFLLCVQFGVLQSEHLRQLCAQHGAVDVFGPAKRRNSAGQEYLSSVLVFQSHEACDSFWNACMTAKGKTDKRRTKVELYLCDMPAPRAAVAELSDSDFPSIGQPSTSSFGGPPPERSPQERVAAIGHFIHGSGFQAGVDILPLLFCSCHTTPSLPPLLCCPPMLPLPWCSSHGAPRKETLPLS